MYVLLVCEKFANYKNIIYRFVRPDSWQPYDPYKNYAKNRITEWYNYIQLYYVSLFLTLYYLYLTEGGVSVHDPRDLNAGITFHSTLHINITVVPPN